MPSYVQVPLRLVCDPVRNQPSDLKEMIEYEHYPPCIQMDLRYDHPEVRPRVVASVKVSTSHNPANSFHLAVKVPGELLIAYSICIVIEGCAHHSHCITQMPSTATLGMHTLECDKLCSYV